MPETLDKDQTCFSYIIPFNFVLNKYCCQRRPFVLLTNLQPHAKRHLLSGSALRDVGVLEMIICTVCVSYTKNNEKQDDFIDYFATT